MATLTQTEATRLAASGDNRAAFIYHFATGSCPVDHVGVTNALAALHQRLTDLERKVWAVERVSALGGTDPTFEQAIREALDR